MLDVSHRSSLCESQFVMEFVMIPRRVVCEPLMSQFGVPAP
jgi:hypothetical protein